MSQRAKLEINYNDFPRFVIVVGKEAGETVFRVEMQERAIGNVWRPTAIVAKSGSFAEAGVILCKTAERFFRKLGLDERRPPKAKK